MKYEVKRDVVNQAELTITVDKETVAKAINKGYMKIAKQVDIPGFRKGKAPKFVIEQKIGQGAILEDAAEIMMAPAYGQAISEEGLNPVARPEVEILEIGEDKEFVFKATVTLQPEPEISEYKGLKLTKKAVEVTEEDIEAHIERMRDRHAKMVTVEEGVVEEDDIAYIDYVGSVDGVEFPGGKGENYPLGIGSDTFIPGFEDQLKGVAVGGDVDVNVTFPEDYHAEDLKGKEALFKVHVNKINRKELAELTDDFVKLISPVETVEEYRTHVAEELEEQAERSAEEDLKNQAIEALLANTEVVIPDVMIEDKIDDFMNDISARLSQQGLNLEQYLQYIGKTVAEIREEQKPSAEKSVKTEVTLLEVAKKENIEATDVDIDAEIAKVALMTNSKPEDIKGRLMESGQFNVLVFSIMLKKSIEFLVANAEIVTE